MEDKELIDYFTRGGAAMGGNTVVIREPRIRYRSGEGKSSRVDVIHVREEMGTHGAEDLGMDSLPIDEESLADLLIRPHYPARSPARGFFQPFLLAAPQCGHSAWEFPSST